VVPILFGVIAFLRRRPGKAKREPGPIATSVSFALGLDHSASSTDHAAAMSASRSRWVPAFAGTTKVEQSSQNFKQPAARKRSFAISRHVPEFCWKHSTR
jgi:hypothetical protein